MVGNIHLNDIDPKIVLTGSTENYQIKNETGILKFEVNGVDGIQINDLAQVSIASETQVARLTVSDIVGSGMHQIASFHGLITNGGSASLNVNCGVGDLGVDQRVDLQVQNSIEPTDFAPLNLNPSGGNVGVGVTAPAGILDINNSIIVAGAPTSTAPADNLIIQAAIEALPPGGGKVILQNGRYVVNQTIELPDGIHFCGASMNGAQIEIAPGVTDISIIRANIPAGKHGVFVIQDLLINGLNNTSELIAIEIPANSVDDSPQPVLINNIHIGQCETGIKVESYFTEINNCYINQCITGIDLAITSFTSMSAGTQSVPPNGHFLGLKVYHLE